MSSREDLCKRSYFPVAQIEQYDGCNKHRFGVDLHVAVLYRLFEYSSESIQNFLDTIEADKEDYSQCKSAGCPQACQTIVSVGKAVHHPAAESVVGYFLSVFGEEAFQ